MNSILRSAILLPSVLAALVVAGCGGATADEARSTTPTGAMTQADIVETATGAGNFRTLVAALKAADLVDTLKGPGPFTVFAPTDEAFAKLPAGTLESLLKPENKAKLQGILTYHVVSGRVGASEVAHMTAAKTVQGKELKITQHGADVMVDGAKVLKADIACTNGVIHVIDAVVLPQ